MFINIMSNLSKQVMSRFKSGEFNVLIATSVAEEGLDIGEVDLIICLEANKSPIKFVQRMGRTGRKRSGKCITLLTEGKEQSVCILYLSLIRYMMLFSRFYSIIVIYLFV